MKVFSAKFGGMPHPPMIGFEQSVKVFSRKLTSYRSVEVFSLESLPLYGSADYCMYVYINTITFIRSSTIMYNTSLAGQTLYLPFPRGKTESRTVARVL